MGAALGAFAGLALGGLAGYAGQKAEQKHEQDQLQRQFTIQGLQTMQERDPAGFAKFIGSDAGKKTLGTVFDKQHIDAATQFMSMQAQSGIAEQQRQQQMLSGGGDLKAHRDRLEQFMATLPPGDPHIPTYQAALKQMNAEIGQEQHEQDYQQTSKRLDQQHADTEADRALTREGLAQGRAEMAGLREQTLAMTGEQQKFERELKTEQDQEKRDELHQKYEQSLDSNRNTVLENFAKAQSAQKPGFKSAVDAYNKSLSRYYAQNPGAGPATLLQWSDGKPSTLGIGGADPEINPINGTYGNYKGKTGFMGDDGYFYPDKN